ncbi:tRNA A64-2'-O-ribosylphosphate transferase [Rhizina undulata]
MPSNSDSFSAAPSFSAEEETFEFSPTFNIDKELLDLELKPKFASIAQSIRKSSRSIRNRLKSIKQDSEFVGTVAEAYRLPIVTNARAGDWYVDPKKRDSTVYFKSTDGHNGEWKFSLRRLNLGLLEVVEKGGGALIVDSTRRGKRFPDSLAKTIPIWIAILNKICFPEEELKLYTSPLAVSPNEVSQIEKRLSNFIKQFNSLGLDIGSIRNKLRKPLRPIWVTPDSPLPTVPPEFFNFVPLVLVTASRMVTGQGTEGEYIQGAGDDHEGWASEYGLTPALFWDNHKILLKASDYELPELIRTFAMDLVTTGVNPEAALDIALIKPTTSLYLGARASVDKIAAGFDVIVNCSIKILNVENQMQVPKIFNFPIPAGKRGAKSLRTELDNIVTSIEPSIGKKVLIVCPSGNDAAAAVALVLLCLFYNDEGQCEKLEDRSQVDKQFIRKKLAWISLSRAEANPSRSSLNAVNSFLMKGDLSKPINQYV